MIWGTLSLGSRRRDQRRGRQSGILCMHTKTIGLIAHTGKRGVAELINSIAEEFERFSISILFEKETARVAGKQRGYPIAELGAMTDLLVVAGGDGSILRVIGQLGEMIKPIFRHQRRLARFPDLREFVELPRSCRMHRKRSD
jgi:Predicted sugar kinase